MTTLKDFTVTSACQDIMEIHSMEAIVQVGGMHFKLCSPIMMTSSKERVVHLSSSFFQPVTAMAMALHVMQPMEIAFVQLKVLLESTVNSVTPMESIEEIL